MRLWQRLKMAFNPKSHDAALSHYIPSVNYADDPVENSVWRSDLEKRLTDWKGDTGRLYSNQILTSQGGLLFALKAVPTAGLGGTGYAYGQGGTYPVAGFAGRPADLNDTSLAAEYEDIN